MQQVSLFDTLFSNSTPILKPPVRLVSVPAPVADVSRINLRSTQAPAMQMARDKISKTGGGHKRGVIYAPCGFGKSVVACAFIEAAIKKGSKVWFVVDRQILVMDMSDKLLSFGIPHGVMMSGSPRWDQYNRTQVVSIQTAEKRGWDSDIDILIVDEAHANMRKSFLDFVEKSPETVIIALTASPFHKDMAKIYSYVVNPTTTNKQIDEGHLVPLEIYQCVEADMKGAKVIAGEYSEKEVEIRGGKIVGDIVSTWYEHTMEKYGKPVKTIVFTANCAHGEAICEAFAAAGFNFQQITHLDKAEDRDAKIVEIRREDSDIIGLVSCGVLTRGFDVTDIQIGIMARPLSKSFSEFIQQVGRIQRAHTWPDGRKKEFGLLLDHAGNVARFLPEMLELFENGVSDLADPADDKPRRKEPTKKEKKDIFCPKCHKLWTGRVDVCSCGYKRKRVSVVDAVPGKMVKVDLKQAKRQAKATHSDKQAFYSQLLMHCHGKGYNEGWAYHKYQEYFGVYPKNLTKEPARITDTVSSWIKSINIRNSKRKETNG